MGGSLGTPAMPGSSPDGALGAFEGPGSMGGAPGAMGGPGGPEMPGQMPSMQAPDMGPASALSLMDKDPNQLTPGAGEGGGQESIGAGAFGMGGLKPASPISGASGFGNGMAGRAGGAFGRSGFGGGASGFGRR
jgi:hypothetical protein